MFCSTFYCGTVAVFRRVVRSRVAEAAEMRRKTSPSQMMRTILTMTASQTVMRSLTRSSSIGSLR